MTAGRSLAAGSPPRTGNKAFPKTAAVVSKPAMHRVFLLVAAATAATAAGTACSAGTGELAAPSPPLSMSPESEPSDPSSTTACPEAGFEAANVHQARQLGLSLAHAIVEGPIGAPEPGPRGPRAQLRIGQVHLGPSFLAGLDVWVEFDDTEAAALPGRFVLGFDGNPLPTWGDDGKPAWWSKLTMIPSGSPETGRPQSMYRSPPFVAIVRIAAQDEDRTRMEVIEPLAGDFPDAFSVNWSRRVYAGDFPPPGQGEFIAGLSHLSYNEPSGIFLGSIADFRPRTAANEALVRGALASASDMIDLPALADRARDYRRAWTFKLAPVVAATRVQGRGKIFSGFIASCWRSATSWLPRRGRGRRRRACACRPNRRFDRLARSSWGAGGTEHPGRTRPTRRHIRPHTALRRQRRECPCT